MTNPARIRRLTLTNFRSYHAATLAVGDGPVVLVGPNGAGKTNLLEAISFLAPGRGLRRATLEEGAFGGGAGARAGRHRDRHRAADERRCRAGAQMPYRPRTGGVRHRLRGSSAGDMAGAGDGGALRPAGRRPAGASLPGGG